MNKLRKEHDSICSLTDNPPDVAFLHQGVLFRSVLCGDVLRGSASQMALPNKAPNPLWITSSASVCPRAKRYCKHSMPRLSFAGKIALRVRFHAESKKLTQRSVISLYLSAGLSGTIVPFPQVSHNTLSDSLLFVLNERELFIISVSSFYPLNDPPILEGHIGGMHLAI